MPRPALSFDDPARIPGDLSIDVDFRGELRLAETVPLFDVAATPDLWVREACATLAARGCVCQAEDATLRLELDGCADDASGWVHVRFGLVEEVAELGLPRTALAEVGIEGLRLGKQPFGQVAGAFATTDGMTFATTRPVRTVDTPIRPENASRPPPPFAPAPSPRSNGTYAAISALIRLFACVVDGRC